MEKVILVDSRDQEIGTEEKMLAHKKGLLHRAFSLLVFNSNGEMLLQKRASHKYHSADLWTNTCCSHPRKGETVEEAAKRRLAEEMGMEADPEFLYKFIYSVSFDNGLSEHELDHVLIARSDNEPNINTEEVSDWKYIGLEELQNKLKAQPELFTRWFQIIMESFPEKVKHLKLA